MIALIYLIIGIILLIIVKRFDLQVMFNMDVPPDRVSGGKNPAGIVLFWPLILLIELMSCTLK